ncbi:hypothetical protein NW762_005551 [Fusarium torreyae]|uniref:Major facilitator superfamily (MFS) profile domain-containing protein n=1 Tax=Fusarium torreyae TaxID=1237075 RepID=A0A9W8S2R9_9HYPO|nr:hypothetical protein NW762_005551 [Fusarium torreyae]
MDAQTEKDSQDVSAELIPINEEEEKRLVRKVDLLLMPLLVLGFFALQLDRGNIGNALTDSFLADVGITQNQFNVGQQLLSAGIIIFEIPSNLVLYRIGPTLWIGGQIIAWGLVATFQAFQKGLGPFLATRFLIGMFEAGFIPASLFTITRWYKKDEISKRFSWFFLGNQLASALSGIIAYGVLHMRGIANLTGWQWLFILEGLFTVVVGITFIVMFPNQVSNPVSLVGIRYFNEKEAEILAQRVLRDDPSKAIMRRHINRQELIAALTNWRLLPHIGLTITGLATASAFAYWILLFFILFWGWFADRVGVRGLVVTSGLLIFWAFNIANQTLIESKNGTLRFIMLAAAISVSWPWHPINGSWVSLNAKSAGERSVSMAIHIMAANCSGLVGGQIFRSEDLPIYRRGWTVIVCLSSAAVFFSLWANLQYYLGNGRKLRRSGLLYAY